MFRGLTGFKLNDKRAHLCGKLRKYVGEGIVTIAKSVSIGYNLKRML
jgi:hypothetical protein